MTLISHFSCPNEALFDLISTQTAILTISGCGAAWLARLLGVQEVPGSNPGSPTIFLIELQLQQHRKTCFWSPKWTPGPARSTGFCGTAKGRTSQRRGFRSAWVAVNGRFMQVAASPSLAAANVIRGGSRHSSRRRGTSPLPPSGVPVIPRVTHELIAGAMTEASSRNRSPVCRGATCPTNFPREW